MKILFIFFLFFSASLSFAEEPMGFCVYTIVVEDANTGKKEQPRSVSFKQMKVFEKRVAP